jgi:thioredoxin reductase (NADPH)
MAAGGQMNTTPDIANYPGFEQISGYELSAAMSGQIKALQAGMITEEVTSLTKADGVFTVATEKNRYTARTVIVAAGAKRRMLNIPGEKEFTGRGVSYCAVCDGNFFRGKNTAVVGGGNTALEDALYLAELCTAVTVIHRRSEFRGGALLQQKVIDNPKIHLKLGFAPVSIEGTQRVESITIKSAEGTEVLKVDAVFAAIGSQAESVLLKNLLPLDSQDRVIAGEDCTTAVPGLFAAGDLRAKPLYQIITAAADGANAAASAGKYLENF